MLPPEQSSKPTLHLAAASTLTRQRTLLLPINAGSSFFLFFFLLLEVIVFNVRTRESLLVITYTLTPRVLSTVGPTYRSFTSQIPTKSQSYAYTSYSPMILSVRNNISRLPVLRSPTKVLMIVSDFLLQHLLSIYEKQALSALFIDPKL